MKIPHYMTWLGSLAAVAVPNVAARPSFLEPRKGGLSVAQKIFKLIERYTDKYDAWEYEHYPEMCLVWFSTHAGGGCQMRVECQDGAKDYNNYNVCEIDKIQYWHDDRIGDFSIQYTSAGDVNGETRDGLHGPYLRIKNINDWEPIKVEEIGAPKDAYGQQVCYIGSKGKDLWWGCGIPKLGRSFGDTQNTIPDGQDGYAHGWCGMHIVQYQKPEPDTTEPVPAQYSLEVWVKDANGDEIGKVSPKVEIKGKPLEVDSKLPNKVSLSTGRVDEDPIKIEYGNDKWSTDDEKRCSVGSYDSGSREMDCGFTC